MGILIVESILKTVAMHNMIFPNNVVYVTNKAIYASHKGPYPESVKKMFRQVSLALLGLVELGGDGVV